MDLTISDDQDRELEFGKCELMETAETFAETDRIVLFVGFPVRTNCSTMMNAIWHKLSELSRQKAWRKSRCI